MDEFDFFAALVAFMATLFLTGHFLTWAFSTSTETPFPCNSKPRFDNDCPLEYKLYRARLLEKERKKRIFGSQPSERDVFHHLHTLATTYFASQPEELAKVYKRTNRLPTRSTNSSLNELRRQDRICDLTDEVVNGTITCQDIAAETLVRAYLMIDPTKRRKWVYDGEWIKREVSEVTDLVITPLAQRRATRVASKVAVTKESTKKASIKQMESIAPQQEDWILVDV